MTGPETCAGCDATSGQHPVVMVGLVAHHEAAPVQTRDGWGAYRVCDTCWRNPANRKRRFKGHFFLRVNLGVALASAGSATITKT